MKKMSRNVLGVILAVVLCLVGALGQKGFVSDWGKVEVTTSKIITESGYELAMNVYIPENATTENKAPAIVVTHGGNDDKDLMTRYSLELARRGYVVAAIDMYSHGDSEWLPDSEWLTAGRGTYDAVREIVTWSFVDTDKISLMGYSRGGKASGEALELDNDELNVVKNIYLLYSDPIYRNEEGFTDVYGARNVAVLADMYDEFFFTEKANDTGVYSNDANRFMETLTSPVDYVVNSSAQSFLYFGTDPENQEQREANTIYEKDYDGIIATREVRTINADHMGGHYDPRLINDMLDFFARVEPSPIGVDSGSGAFLGYDLFALVGMIGLCTFIVFAAALITERTKFFADITNPKPIIALVTSKKAKKWYWITVVAGIVVNVFAVWFVNKTKLSAWFDPIFRSARFVYIPAICLIASAFAILLGILSFKMGQSGENSRAKEIAGKIIIGGKSALKTLLLAFVVVTLLYFIVFGVKYFTGTTFKFTMWGFQTFSAGRIPFMFLTAPLFTLFYVATSINNDGVGYTSILTKNKTVNCLLTAFISALPMLVVMIYFYGSFRLTGWNPMFGGNAGAGTNIYPFAMIIFVLVIISRKIYEKTGNVYLGAIIAGFINAIMTCSVCEIRFPEADATLKLSWIFMSLIVLAIVALVCGLRFYKKQLNK